jgi:putative membrane protein
MAGAIPADLMQYYAHALRIMQKLAYLYGWRDLLNDMDEVDDETIGILAVFFGVMLGVGGAAQSLTTFARSVAMPAFQKQFAKQALTKTSWYPVMKHSLKYIGVQVTKDGLASGASKAIPVVGGFLSGGMTFVSLQSQSHRLKNHLRELPAPGVDAEVWKQAVSDATPDDQEPGVLDNAQQVLESTTKAVTSGAKTAASGIADGAMTAASGIAEGVKGLFGRRK